MSQLAAPTRAPRRAGASRTRPRTAPRSIRPASRPVAPVKVATRSHGSRFMWLVAVVAFFAALSMLLLNTMRAEQSFTISTLRGDVSTLDDREQALRSEIAAVSAPEQVALKADGYGMVRSSQVTYVSRATGTKLGVAGSATGGSSLNVNTLPNTPSSRAASELISSGSLGLHVTDPVARAKAAQDAAAKNAAGEKAAKDAGSKNAGFKDAAPSHSTSGGSAGKPAATSPKK